MDAGDATLLIIDDLHSPPKLDAHYESLALVVVRDTAGLERFMRSVVGALDSVLGVESLLETRVHKLRLPWFLRVLEAKVRQALNPRTG